MNLRIIRFFASVLLIFVGEFAASAPVKLYFRSICGIDQNGSSVIPLNAMAISNLMSVVNVYFSQVALDFEIKSIDSTNILELAWVRCDDYESLERISEIGGETDGVKIYFVCGLIGDCGVYTPYGIFVDRNVNAQILAHELGHACGLLDVYDSIESVDLSVEGPPSRDRMPFDFGRYPVDCSHADVLSRILMYGYAVETAIDIPYGDVYGLWYTNMTTTVTNQVDATMLSDVFKDWRLGLAPIGFKLHGNRNPINE